ncbi:hypothetical protein B8W69_26980 [Mycobacterium vulneris]|uniref:Uncharacterized protein n=1 Tax=Mycolicibacterium vulneris TaxID=547163 RepID=A0A1X2KJZ0_9MYCO|nr:hypothetical protein [Mycolicibacterium vulneris]OSC22100.1 hypothetical protein B8W69_26980 [Mycolicibacterium vulneris]
MTSESRDPSALRAADGRSLARSGDRAPDSVGGRTARNPVPRLRFPSCERCQEPITTRKAYARTSIAAARDRARRRRRGQEQGPLIEWHFMHAACDPDVADPAAYFIGAGAARTARGLLVEVLKLTGRDWAEDTDWRRMVAAILAESRPQPGDD